MKILALLLTAYLLTGCSVVPGPYGYAVFFGGKGAMEAFAKEGWLPAGAFWSRDAQHFQATQ